MRAGLVTEGCGASRLAGEGCHGRSYHSAVGLVLFRGLLGRATASSAYGDYCVGGVAYSARW